MPRRAARRERFGLHRLEPQHVDAEARVDPAHLQRKDRADAVGIVRGAGKAHLHHLGRVIAAMRLEPQPPGAAPRLAQPCADPVHQPVEPGHDVGLQPDGIGQREPRGEGPGRRRGRDGLWRRAQRLIQPRHQAGAEAAGKRRARLPRQVADGAQAEAGKLLGHVRFDPQRGDRQGGERAARLPRRRDAPAVLQRAAAFPAAPGGLRAGRARLLLDGVARAGGHRTAASVTRQCPGRALRVRDGAAHGQAEARAVLCQPVDQRRFAAEEMRAAGDVRHQPVGRRLGHPGADAPRPAPERREKCRLGRRARPARDQIGANRHRVGQRLAAGDPRRLGRGRKRGHHLPLPLVPDDGEGGVRLRRAKAQQALGGEPGKPDRQDAAGGHRRAARCSLFVQSGF